MTKRRPVNSRIPEDDSIMEEIRLRCKRQGEELRALKEQVLANAIYELIWFDRAAGIARAWKDSHQAGNSMSGRFTLADWITE